MSHQAVRIVMLDGASVVVKRMTEAFAGESVSLREHRQWRSDENRLPENELDLAVLFDDNADPRIVESFQVWRKLNPGLPVVIVTREGRLSKFDEWWEVGPCDVLPLEEVSASRLLRAVQWSVRMTQIDSDRRLLLERQRRLSQTDPLTGLLNRESFRKALVQTWQNSLIPGNSIACLAINIDHFRVLNEHLGSQDADDLLRHVSRFFAEFFSETGFVSRTSSDLFHVILRNGKEEVTQELAARLVEEVRQHEFEISGNAVSLTVSVGISKLDAMMDHPEVVVNQADEALKIAQQHGRDQYATYVDPDRFEPELVSRDSQLWLNANAKDLMIPCITPLMESQSLVTAVRLLMIMRTDSLPVVDDDGQLVGMILEEDLICRGMSNAKWTGGVSSLMRKKPVCFELDTPAHVVVDFLARVSSRRILVVNGDRTVGIVSRYSVLRWMHNHYIADSPDHQAEQFSQQQGGSFVTPELQRVVGSLHLSSRKLSESLEAAEDDLSVKLLAEATRMQELIDQMLGLSPGAQTSDSSTGSLGALLGS